MGSQVQSLSWFIISHTVALCTEAQSLSCILWHYILKQAITEKQKTRPTKSDGDSPQFWKKIAAEYMAGEEAKAAAANKTSKIEDMWEATISYYNMLYYVHFIATSMSH